VKINLNFFFFKKINLIKIKNNLIFFTGEERRNFAVFIPKLFQYDYEFVIKVINFGFF